jgi:hypothetical protein
LAKKSGKKQGIYGRANWAQGIFVESFRVFGLSGLALSLKKAQITLVWNPNFNCFTFKLEFYGQIISPPLAACFLGKPALGTKRPIGGIF